MVPLIISHDIHPVLAFHHPGCFTPTRPLRAGLRISIRIEHRQRIFIKMDAIRTFRQADARGMVAEHHRPGIIFGSI